MFGFMGGGGEAKEDEDAFDIDDAEADLIESETKILGYCNADIPDVKIGFPKVSPEAFGAEPEVEQPPQSTPPKPWYAVPALPTLPEWCPSSVVVPLQPESSPLLQDGSPAPADGEAAPPPAGQRKKPKKEKPLTEAQKKIAETKRKLAEEKARVAEKMKKMKEAAKIKADEAKAVVRKMLMIQVVPPVLSIAIAVGATVGKISPVVTAMVAAVMNTLGLANTWKASMAGIRGPILDIVQLGKDNVMGALDEVDDMLDTPVTDLMDAIDGLLQSQRPLIKKIKDVQDKLPGVEIPDPDDLKQPLLAAPAMIEDFLGRIKKNIPEQMDGLLDSIFPLKVVNHDSLWMMFAVAVPMIIVMLLNLIISLIPVLLMPAPAEAAPEAAVPAASRLLSGRFLAGVGTQSQEIPPESTDELPFGMTKEEFKPQLISALVPIVLVAIQTALSMVATKGPRIAKAVNGLIKMLEKKVNKSVNDTIDELIAKIFDIAFKEVKTQAEKFFAQIKDIITQVKPIFELQAKMGALMG